MEELLRLARELRPAALDDHGLARRAAHAGRRVRRADRRSTPTSSPSRRRSTTLGAERADRRLPHRPGEPLERRPPRRCAQRARRASSREPGATVVRVADDGDGFDPGAVAAGPRAARDARARRSWPAARCDVHSAPGAGTDHRTATGGAPHEHRVLIADDHGVVRGGLRLLLDRQPDMEVVGEAADGVEAVERDARAAPRRRDPRRLDAAADRPAGHARDQGAGARGRRARCSRCTTTSATSSRR